MAAPRAQIDEAQFRQLASEGYNSVEIAAEIGCSRQLVMRFARFMDIDVPGNKQLKPNTCRRKVQDMPLRDAVEYLLNAIEVICPAQDDSQLMEVIALGFAPSEAQILLLIFSRPMAPKEVMFNSIYGLHAGPNIPDQKIIDVWVCKIRAKLLVLGWPIRIETVWGRGYRGVRENGFLFPWEQI